MIALQHARFGEPADVIAPVEIPVPEPGPGEVRVRVARSPIHNHDLATIRGTYGYKPELPASGGSELVGIIDAVGSGVTHVAAGDRVATTTRGAWAEYALATAAAVVPMPDAIDDDRACQLLAMPTSAVVLLDELHVQPGEWIVQNAANGAVGTILMRAAQARGVNVINLVRRESAAAAMRELGAQHVVVTEGDWQPRVREIAGNAPVVRAIDSVTGAQSLEMQRLLGRGGELVVFGGLAGSAMKLDPSLMISNELTVRGFWMTAWMQRATYEQRFAAIQRVFELALSGQLPLPVQGVYSLNDAAQALHAAEAPGRHGKVLFRP